MSIHWGQVEQGQGQPFLGRDHRPAPVPPRSPFLAPLLHRLWATNHWRHPKAICKTAAKTHPNWHTHVSEFVWNRGKNTTPKLTSLFGCKLKPLRQCYTRNPMNFYFPQKVTLTSGEEDLKNAHLTHTWKAWRGWPCCPGGMLPTAVPWPGCASHGSQVRGWSCAGLPQH